jgi:glycine betaine/choline ABC-type transport system substrate-binding protein
MPEFEPLAPDDPREIAGYPVRGRLGEGGQGVVFLADDDGEPVAIKLFHVGLDPDDTAALDALQTELTVVRSVPSFCTARIRDVGRSDGRPYTVAEYVDGVSLHACVRADGPMRGDDLNRLAIGTITALAATHAAGVVHRDFKPHNIVLSADGPRLIDFGVARALELAVPDAGSRWGTPAYMAPEQVDGGEAGPAADVFSWGVTMVFAATGRPAFGEISDRTVFSRIRHAAPDTSDLPSPLRELVNRCLAKDPALRPTASDALMHLIDHRTLPPGGTRNEPPGPRTPTVDRRAEPAPPSDPQQALASSPLFTSRRFRATFAAAAAALVVAAVVAVPMVWHERTSARPDAGRPLPARASRQITVGSANFAESTLIGEIYAQILQARGYQVVRRFDLGSREVYYRQVTSGEVDVMPEYNGALASYIGAASGDGSGPTTTDAVNAQLRRKLPPTLELLPSARAEDKDSLTVTARTADQYGLRSIDDLRDVPPGFVVGAASEFESRREGMVGLRAAYRLNLSFQPLQTGDRRSLVQMLENGSIQAANLFTTDPAIAAKRFVVLADPNHLFSAQNVTPLIYRAALDAGARQALSAVSDRLTTRDLLDMNARIDGGKPTAAVATDWLKDVGLIPS